MHQETTASLDIFLVAATSISDQKVHNEPLLPPAGFRWILDESTGDHKVVSCRRAVI